MHAHSTLVPLRQPAMDATHTSFVTRRLRSSDSSMLAPALRMRAEVFGLELGWVPYPANGHEWDRCDPLAYHFTLFATDGASTRLAGYARVLVPPSNFMLEREFVRLLANEPLQYSRETTFEVSRFVIHPGWRGKRDRDGRSAVDHLGRAIVQWALSNNRSLWLSVCEARHVRALRSRGLEFERFGAVVEYQPGVHACAARLDLACAMERMRTDRAAQLEWYCATTPYAAHRRLEIQSITEGSSCD
ncbi:MAG: GNAT family N-acetyltransferase [Chloroflexota bacterium]|nr:GNAT family N-acetyltransferase [Chloroflexota bacterium]